MSKEVKNKTEEVPQEGEFKMKRKPGRPKKLTQKKDEVTKVELKKEENAVQESSTEKMDVDGKSTDGGKMGETHVESSKPSTESQEVEKEEEVNDSPVIEEITPSETKEVKPKEEVKPSPTSEPVIAETKLPENIEKLVDFMKDTGGTVEDYVKLSKDYSKLNNEQKLREYYRTTKPYLSDSEITFHMEEQFAWDEEEDSDKEITHKKIVLKEELAKADNFLNGLKNKYYDEIKLKSNVTPDQQKAIDFYNIHSQEQSKRATRHENFKNGTQEFFNNFEGFEFKVGEKAFKYNINNTQDTANKQSDLLDFIGKFQNKEGEVTDLQGYHKALYAARNADNLARHFYEQGKADAVKNITAKSNNVSTDINQQAPGDMFINGYKVRAISGDDSSRLKIKGKK